MANYQQGSAPYNNFYPPYPPPYSSRPPGFPPPQPPLPSSAPPPSLHNQQPHTGPSSALPPTIHNQQPHTSTQYTQPQPAITSSSSCHYTLQQTACAPPPSQYARSPTNLQPPSQYAQTPASAQPPSQYAQPPSGAPPLTSAPPPSHYAKQPSAGAPPPSQYAQQSPAGAPPPSHYNQPPTGPTPPGHYAQPPTGAAPQKHYDQSPRGAAPPSSFAPTQYNHQLQGVSAPPPKINPNFQKGPVPPSFPPSQHGNFPSSQPISGQDSAQQQPMRNQLPAQPISNETPEPIRTGLTGVKRKGLAHELLGSKATTHHLSWTRLWDVEMPKELMSRCQPLFCDLCKSPFSSPVQAKMHYEGKTHDKHVRNYYTKLGVSQANLPSKMDSSGKFPRLSTFRCDICNLDFISEPIYTQHIMGKNHNRMISGQSETKATHFNKQTNRFEKTAVFTAAEVAKKKTVDPASAFFCEVCKVGAPSQSQLDVHLSGKNHKKKMDRGMGGVDSTDLGNINKRMKFKETIMNKMTGGGVQQAPMSMGMRGGGIFGRRGEVLSRGAKDYSIYRTPSGNYYCSSCNVTVQNPAQFEQHSSSKKHKQKESVQKARN